MSHKKKQIKFNQKSSEKKSNSHLESHSAADSIKNNKRTKLQDLHQQAVKAKAQRGRYTRNSIKNHTLVHELQNIQSDNQENNTKKYCGRIVKNKINQYETLVEIPQLAFFSKNTITNVPQKQRSLTFWGLQTSEKFINKFVSNEKKFKHFVQREKNKSAKKFERSFLRSASLVVRQIQSNETLSKTFQGTIIKNISKNLPHNEQASFFTTLESKFLDFKLLGAIKAAQNSIISKRPINFTISTIPVIPQPPAHNCSLESLMESILSVLPLADVKIIRDQFAGCSLKKYRNCIVFGLPNNDRFRLVWHFTGKLYMGEWSKQTNEKVGLGLQIIPNKQYYKGEFSSGKKYGKGIFLKSDGIIYEGEFINGFKHGKGRYFNPKENSYYQGEWSQDKMFGNGFLQIIDNLFQGNFKYDRKQGFGVQLFQNGDKYVGQYLQDKFHGQGKYIWANGSFYLGHFKHGNREGFGKWVSEEQQGQFYIGFYTNDNKQGTGKYIWKNGCVYEGNFQMDKKEGMGNLQYPDGRTVQGIWKNGQLTKVIGKMNDAHVNQPLLGKKFSKEKRNKKIIYKSQL